MEPGAALNVAFRDIEEPAMETEKEQWCGKQIERN
jgi:hypothetical protein